MTALQGAEVASCAVMLAAQQLRYGAAAVRRLRARAALAGPLARAAQLPGLTWCRLCPRTPPVPAIRCGRQTSRAARTISCTVARGGAGGTAGAVAAPARHRPGGPRRGSFVRQLLVRNAPKMNRKAGARALLAACR